MSDARRARRLLARHLEGGLDPAGEEELLALLREDPALAAEAAAQERVAAMLAHRERRLDDARFVDEVVAATRYLGEERGFADRVGARLEGRAGRRVAAAAAAIILAVTALVVGRGGSGAGEAPEAEARVERSDLRDGGRFAAGSALDLPAAARARLAYPDGSTLALPGGSALRGLPGDGKRLALDRGSVDARVQPQPAGRPLRLALGFLELSSPGALFTASLGSSGAELRVLEGRVRVQRPADGLRLDLQGGYELRLGERGPAVPVLVRDLELSADLSSRAQRIEGFGTSMLDWKPRLASLYRTEAFAELWARDLGASILRVPVEPELLAAECADAASIDESRLDWEHPTARLVCDLARSLRARRGPDFQLVATVWSPPGWMKTTGRTVGTGRLRDDRRAHFARFLAAWCRGVEARSGVPVAAVSVRSEAEWGVRFASCSWSPEEFLAATEEIQSAFTRSGVRARILGPELVGRSRLEPMDEAEAFVRGLGARAAGCSLALQGPLGPGADDASAWDRLRRTLDSRGRGLWVTSAADHLPDWIGPGGALSLAGDLHDALVHGGAEAFLYYQLADEDPLVSLSSSADPRAPKYAAFKHYSAFVRPGSVRVPATPDGAALAVAAFWHDPSSTFTAVLVNSETEPIRAGLRVPGAEGPLAVFVSDAARRCEPAGRLVPAGGRWSLEVPAKSVVTLQSVR